MKCRFLHRQQIAGVLTVPVVLMFSLLACPRVSATVILTVYHSGELYVGSDSLVTSDTTNKFLSNKLFPVSKTCVVGVGRCYGGLIVDGTNAPTLLFLPQELARLCRENCEVQEPLENKIGRLCSGFAVQHKKYISGTQSTPCETWLLFMGYDPEKECFFMSSYVLNATNVAALQPVFRKIPKDPVGCIEVFGQEVFFGTLFATLLKMPAPGDKLAPYVTADFRSTFLRIYVGEPVSIEKMKNFILEIFQLNEQLAIRLGFDTRPIAPPFPLFRITSDGTTKIN